MKLTARATRSCFRLFWDSAAPRSFHFPSVFELTGLLSAQLLSLSLPPGTSIQSTIAEDQKRPCEAGNDLASVKKTKTCENQQPSRVNFFRIELKLVRMFYASTYVGYVVRSLQCRRVSSALIAKIRRGPVGSEQLWLYMQPVLVILQPVLVI